MYGYVEVFVQMSHAVMDGKSICFSDFMTHFWSVRRASGVVANVSLALRINDGFL